MYNVTPIKEAAKGFFAAHAARIIDKVWRIGQTNPDEFNAEEASKVIGLATNFLIRDDVTITEAQDFLEALEAAGPFPTTPNVHSLFADLTGWEYSEVTDKAIQLTSRFVSAKAEV